MGTPRKSKKAEQAVQQDDAVTSLITLTDVIAATQNGSFIYTPASFHEPLVASGQVELNLDMVDEHGNIATRAVLAEQEQPKEDTPVTQPTQKPIFEIKTASELPVRVRKSGGNRAGRAPMYPFAELEVNQYFFVPNKEGKAPAAKALASTVAGANLRFAEVIEGQTRVNRKGATVPDTRQLRTFKVFDSEEDGVPGAKVFRVE